MRTREGAYIRLQHILYSSCGVCCAVVVLRYTFAALLDTPCLVYVFSLLSTVCCLFDLTDSPGAGLRRLLNFTFWKNCCGMM